MPLPAVIGGAIAVGRFALPYLPWAIGALASASSALPQYVQTVTVQVTATRKAKLRDAQALAYAIAFGELDKTGTQSWGSSFSVQLKVDRMSRSVFLSVQIVYNGMVDRIAQKPKAGRLAMTSPLNGDVVGGDWADFWLPPDEANAPKPLPAKDQLVATEGDGEGHGPPNDGFGTGFARAVAASLLRQCQVPSRPDFDYKLSELSTSPPPVTPTTDLVGTPYPTLPPPPPPPPPLTDNDLIAFVPRS